MHNLKVNLKLDMSNIKGTRPKNLLIHKLIIFNSAISLNVTCMFLTRINKLKLSSGYKTPKNTKSNNKKSNNTMSNNKKSKNKKSNYKTPKITHHPKKNVQR